MRNLNLIDAVIALHDIARLVEEEAANDVLARDIRHCADQLHEISVAERVHEVQADSMIDRAKNLIKGLNK